MLLVWVPLIYFASPSESWVLRPACVPFGPEADQPFQQAPLLRSIAPPTLPASSVHHPRRCLPLRSVLAVSHDLDGLLRSSPSRDLPGLRSWGSAPFRVSPASHWVLPLPVAPSPHGLASTAPRLPRASDHRSDRLRAALVCLQGVPCESTVSACFVFPLRRGSTPSWASSFGTAAEAAVPVTF